MFHEYAGVRILKHFLDHPYREFYLREVSRAAKVGPSTAKRCLDRLTKEGLLERHRMGNMVLFKASMNPAFKQIKVADNILRLQGSKIIEELIDEFEPLSITLFGSMARGENDSKSDLDLLILSRKPSSRGEFLVYTPTKWKEKAKADPAFYERIVTEGIPLLGDLPLV